ncbi:MAG TPA: hypothetical protein DCM07_08780 [Planctomycetaceae bacterium]|nr:hypothetical protein [Planctomycetaceae bacterium]
MIDNCHACTQVEPASKPVSFRSTVQSEQNQHQDSMRLKLHRLCWFWRLKSKVVAIRIRPGKLLRLRHSRDPCEFSRLRKIQSFRQ